MIKNHLKIAWRYLLKNRSYFMINLAGLSIALLVAILMLLWAQDEYSTDKFHENDARLFSVKRKIPLETGVFDVYASTSYPLISTAVEEFPEVQKYIGIGRSFEDNLRFGDIDLRANGTFANADLFHGFSYPLLQGDIDQLDNKPEAMAISEKLAHRIWGDQWKTQAVGSSIEVLDVGEYTVEVVYKDFPGNSSLQNDFYYSFKGYLAQNDWLEKWDNNGMQGVLLLAEGANPKQVAKKMEELYQSHLTGENKEGLFLQKFSDNYLYGKYDDQANISGGRIDYVRTFTWAALFLLVISCINFVNLSTAHAIKRAGEIGVRKVIGAAKKSLVVQFFVETALVTSLAFFMAIILVILLLPIVNTMVGKELTLSFSELRTWLLLGAAFVVTTICSGIYPSIIIASYKPIAALKGKTQELKSTATLRKGLVVLQFGLTVVLILAALVVKQQIDFINTKDLGLQKDHLISIHQDQVLLDKYDVLKSELMQSEGIADITLAGPSPLNMGASTSGVQWPGKTEGQENIDFAMLWAAHNFPKVFDIPLHEGNYYREGSVDTTNIVLNQKAIEIMGLEDPVGKSVQLWGKPRQILGVLKDFHNRSLYEDIEPAIFFLDPNNAGELFIKLKAGETKQGLASVEKVFSKALPDLPLHYTFLDERFAKTYKTETLTGKLAYYFAMMSIVISCLGLFGLASFMAKQRTKEIGIRKVLGATIGGITLMISMDFLKLVVLAVCIASPVAYYLLSGWLGDFAYRINIHWGVFVVTAILALLIALLTVGYQSIRSAMADPVKSLRTE